jgi:hypothetical protein
MTPNGPRLSIQQLEHAIQVYEKRVQAKKLEIDSYAKFRDHAPEAFTMILGHVQSNMDLLAVEHLFNATKNLFTAKVNQGILDLEELELQVKALHQARSGIVIPR